MVTKDLDAPRPAQVEEDEEEGFDLARAKELAGFAWRAPRRRPKLAFGTFGAIVALTLAAAALWPRTYNADVRILAQRNLVLPALGNPNRAVPREADSPTHNVADVILQRENLVSLIKQADLLDRWDAQRPALNKMKDSISQMISGPPSDEDKMRALIGLLEKKLTITADDTTVTISVDWSNAQMAYELATLLQKNFFDARYDTDINVISDAISILEQHAQEEKDKIDVALAEAERVQKEHTGAPAPITSASSASSVPATQAPRQVVLRPASSPATSTAIAAAPVATAAPPPPDPALTAALAQKKDAIKAIEDVRARRLADLNRQLSEALVTLAPAHPTVLALRQSIDQASQDPPELVQLLSDERAIEAQIAAASTPSTAAAGAGTASAPPATTAVTATRPAVVAQPGAPPAAGTPMTNTSSAALARLGAALPNEDPATAVARQKLQDATLKYDEIMARIESARIELDVSRAAFKYKFSIVRPPEVPLKPTKPNVAVLVLAGLFLSLLLGLGGAAAADLMGGRFIEPWQVQRKLKIPLLGEVTPTGD
jgi:uncharacterized protein involved in exopolysaccharide biosynthesis